MSESDPSSPEFNEKYRSPRDAALHLMCESGWANESSGSTRSYQGYFWRITNEPADMQEVADAFSDEFTQAGLTDTAQLVGHFVVVDFGQGQIRVDQFDTQAEAVDDYESRKAAYDIWVAEQQP